MFLNTKNSYVKFMMKAIKSEDSSVSFSNAVQLPVVLFLDCELLCTVTYGLAILSYIFI